MADWEPCIAVTWAHRVASWSRMLDSAMSEAPGGAGPLFGFDVGLPDVGPDEDASLDDGA